uniref:Uncharacterized protein n=1 Tax=Oryza punctata TaxID=4537 RepID=A0A0E0JG38_ORYPU
MAFVTTLQLLFVFPAWCTLASYVALSLLKSKTCLPRSQPDSDIDSYLRDAFCFDCECGFAQAHCGHHKTHSWVGITQYLDQACMVIPNDATGALYDAFDGIQLMLWAAIWCHSTEGKHPGVLSARGG